MRIGFPPTALVLAVAGLVILLWLCYAESCRSVDAETDRRRLRRDRRRPPPREPIPAAPAPKSFVETITGSSLFSMKTMGDFMRMKHEVNSLDDLIKKVEPATAAEGYDLTVG